MSKFRIKLKLHPSEEAANNPAVAATPTSQATQVHAGDETGEAASDAGGADVSMATSSQYHAAMNSIQAPHFLTLLSPRLSLTDAADSEDELASDEEDDEGSNAPSSAADGIVGQHLQRSLGSSSSRINSPSLVAPVKGKRKPTIRDEVGHMTAEELDALPPAKRRKGAKARGAPGPGRGWRKGLKMGQKPIYALPDTTPIAEGQFYSNSTDSRSDLLCYGSLIVVLTCFNSFLPSTLFRHTRYLSFRLPSSLTSFRFVPLPHALDFSRHRAFGIRQQGHKDR